MPHGVFTWNELLTSDVEKAKTFFAETIGWTFTGKPIPLGTYWLAEVDGKPVAGIMDMKDVTPPGVPPHWISYLEVDDVDARVKAVRDHGGEVQREPFDIEGVGRIALIADPTGGFMGWMSWAKSPAG